MVYRTSWTYYTYFKKTQKTLKTNKCILISRFRGYQWKMWQDQKEVQPMVLSVGKPQLGTGHQEQDFQWGCCLNSPRRRGTHQIWSIYLINKRILRLYLNDSSYKRHTGIDSQELHSLSPTWQNCGSGQEWLHKWSDSENSTCLAA